MPAASSGTSKETILELQSQLHADDIPLPPDIEGWTEEQVQEYFESGGEIKPDSRPASIEERIHSLETGTGVDLDGDGIVGNGIGDGNRK